MELTTDIILKGTTWDKAINSFSSIFKTRTQYSMYMVCVSIGIMYDKRIDTSLISDEDIQHSIARNVIRNNENGLLEYFFQAAIMTTKTETLTEKDRLELAFGEGNNFKKIDFLTQFANFGVTKLIELIGDTSRESMEQIKNFIYATIENQNIDIDELPDDILLEGNE